MLIAHMLFAACINLLNIRIALFTNHSMIATTPLNIPFEIQTNQSIIVVKALLTSSFDVFNRLTINHIHSLNAALIFVRIVFASHTINCHMAENMPFNDSIHKFHAILIFSTNQAKSPVNNALNAANIADK